jgi:hypothetical protein
LSSDNSEFLSVLYILFVEKAEILLFMGAFLTFWISGGTAYRGTGTR